MFGYNPTNQKEFKILVSEFNKLQIELVFALSLIKVNVFYEDKYNKYIIITPFNKGNISKIRINIEDITIVINIV